MDFEKAVAIAGGISLLLALSGQFVEIFKKMKAPNQKQNERLEDHERQLREIHEKLNNDNKRIMAQGESTRLTHKALLALLDHGLNGNNVKQMDEARQALQNHLINQ